MSHGQVRVVQTPRAIILVPTAETARVTNRVILALSLLVVGLRVVVA